jgi:hypothetical protein
MLQGLLINTCKLWAKFGTMAVGLRRMADFRFELATLVGHRLTAIDLKIRILRRMEQ